MNLLFLLRVLNVCLPLISSLKRNSLLSTLNSRSITLKGPDHPLEVKLHCLHRMGTAKAVKIEQVNIYCFFEQNLKSGFKES